MALLIWDNLLFEWDWGLFEVRLTLEGLAMEVFLQVKHFCPFLSIDVSIYQPIFSISSVFISYLFTLAQLWIQMGPEELMAPSQQAMASQQIPCSSDTAKC